MATMFNTQTGEGKFKLQFETDDLTCYRVMQELARLCVDRDQHRAEKSEPEKPKTYEITAIHTVEITKIMKGVTDCELGDHVEHLKEVTPGALKDLLRDVIPYADDIKTVGAQTFVREETADK